MYELIQVSERDYSCLSRLKDVGRVQALFEDSMLLWQRA